MNEQSRSVLTCSECHRAGSSEQMRIIDGQPVCLKCLYGDAKAFEIWPIGVVVNDKRRRPDGFGTTGSDISEIRLFPGQVRFTKGLADETHLTIVWYLHQSGNVKTEFARGRDGKLVGPFASRTPDRLTPIAVTDVELLEVRNNSLFVRGLDAINGSPVLDIKTSFRSFKNSATRSQR